MCKPCSVEVMKYLFERIKCFSAEAMMAVALPEYGEQSRSKRARCLLPVRTKRTQRLIVEFCIWPKRWSPLRSSTLWCLLWLL